MKIFLLQISQRSQNQQDIHDYLQGLIRSFHLIYLQRPIRSFHLILS